MHVLTVYLAMFCSFLCKDFLVAVYSHIPSLDVYKLSKDAFAVSNRIMSSLIDRLLAVVHIRFKEKANAMAALPSLPMTSPVAAANPLSASTAEMPLVEWMNVPRDLKTLKVTTLKIETKQGHARHTLA